MSRNCDRPIGQSRKEFRDRLTRAIRLASLPLALGAGVAASARDTGLITQGILAAMFLLVTLLGAFGYLAAIPATRPRIDWTLHRGPDRDHGFPITCASGWLSLARSISTGMWMAMILFVAVAVHLSFAYEFVLRIPQRIRIYRQQVMANSMHPERRRFEREIREHLLRCKIGNNKVKRTRRLANARRSAAHRKRIATKDTRAHGWHVRVDKVLRSYEDTAAWIAAFMASASLFPAFVDLLEPGPIGAMLLFMPVALAPVVDGLRRRYLRRPARAIHVATDSGDVLIAWPLQADDRSTALALKPSTTPAH